MNHNKEIAIFIKTFREKGFLKSKIYNKHVYFIKIETYDNDKINSILKNSKYAAYIVSVNNEKKSFYLIMIWIDENQRRSLFFFEQSFFFKDARNKIKIFSLSEEKFSLPLVFFNFNLLFKDKVKQVGHPRARYIEKAFQVQDEYSDLFPIFKIDLIPAYNYLINPKKKEKSILRLNLESGIFETVWISKGQEFIQKHDKKIFMILKTFILEKTKIKVEANQSEFCLFLNVGANQSEFCLFFNVEANQSDKVCF